MKQNTLIYHQGICKLKKYGFTESINYEWVPKKYWFFGLILVRDEGFSFTWDWDHEIISEERILRDNCIIKDKVVYVKPRIELKLMDQGSMTYYFDSVEEIEKFIVDEGLDKIPHVKI